MAYEICNKRTKTKHPSAGLIFINKLQRVFLGHTQWSESAVSNAERTPKQWENIFTDMYLTMQQTRVNNCV